jgi:16S rRNA (uracil1498-N3)-methyltransferase
MPRGLHRFFVNPALLGGERVEIVGEQAHQISRVLRLKAGDRLVVVGGNGREYVVRLDEVRSSVVAGAVESVECSQPEPSLILTLYQALIPRDRFETVLQKGTEIGITRFVPTACERSIVPGGDRIDERRLERWRRIVTEAAEQCERGIVPEISTPLSYADALANASTAPTIVAWERESGRSVRDGLDAALGSSAAGRARLGLFVGPEGGFTASEIELARRHGAHTVSLGPRILRTETVGPILAALALYHVGDLVPAQARSP